MLQNVLLYKSDKSVCCINRTKATQISSRVCELNRSRYSALELIRLLSLIRDCSQALDCPSIVSRTIWVACDVTRDERAVTNTYGTSISRRRLETWLRVAGICSGSCACNYRNVRDDNEERFCPPRGDQLHARGPKKCRGLVRAPVLCNSKIVTSFWPLNGSCSAEYPDNRALRRW